MDVYIKKKVYDHGTAQAVPILATDDHKIWLDFFAST